MALVKRYTSRNIIFELKKLKNGYQIKEKNLDKEGDFEDVFRHAGIRSLFEASKELNGLVREAETEKGAKFSAYSVY